MRWGFGTVGRWAFLCAIAAVGLGLPAAAVGLPASSSGAPSRVRVGAAPALARDAKAVTALPASTRLHLTVVLKPRDPAALAAFARAVSTPGSSVYRDYLTPAEFANRFGATGAQVSAVRFSLSAHGLTPGTVSPNGLSIPVTATAAQAESAFSVSLRRLSLSHGKLQTLPSAAPAVDASIAGDVQTVLGLSSTYSFQPQLRRRAIQGPARRPGLIHSARHAATGGPQPCPAASSNASQQGAYTADQIASAYGFSSLYQQGDQGAGQTVAIYELEPNDPNDIAAYQSCYGTHASVSYLPVDGGAGTGEGSGEAALDIENAIGLAPQANYLVYQGPNSNSSAPGSGPYDTFNAIISQDRAQVVSVSWGECEAQNTDGLQAENTLFQEAAAQGQSIVSASGDEGSEDCYCPPSLGGCLPVPDLSLAVDDPASQAFVTGVGGTTLNSPGPPPGQVVWNNGAVLGAAGQGGAGGGGISSVWSMPSYQSGAGGSLHVIGSNSSGSQCRATSGFCRQVPDVSADADPNTGYIVYWNGSNSDPTSTAGWQSIGGTSAAAPVWAALLAVINASSGCHSSPIGFANPALYRAATSAYAATFTDITSGTNDMTSTNGGLYTAATGFDMATGLGTPIGGGLAASLCAVTARIATPSSQRTTVGQSVGLQLKIVGSVLGTPSWRASGLPPGLSIAGSSGRISGRLRRAGAYRVVVAATAGGVPLRQVAFSWIVVGRPALSRVALRGIAAGRPSLSLAIARGFAALPLKTVTVALPSGLRFGPRGGAVTVTGANGRRTRFSARVVRGRLQITLAVAQTRIGLKIGRIATTSALASRVRGHRVKSLRVSVTATDSARRGSTVSARIRPA